MNNGAYNSNETILNIAFDDEETRSEVRKVFEEHGRQA